MVSKYRSGIIQEQRQTGRRSVPWCVALLSLCLAMGLTGVRPAAAGLSTVGVAPITAEADVQPGSTYTASIRVQNEASSDPGAPPSSPVRIKVYAVDWTLTPDGTPQFAAAGTLPGSCAKWVEINPAEFDLQPGQIQEVRYTLMVPPDARGTYHTILMFEAGGQPVKLRGGGMTVIGRVGSTLYITVGPHHRSGHIVGFRATATGVSLSVANEGDDHLRLTGGIMVKDSAGKLVREEKLSGAVVLPHHDNRRQLKLSWATPLPAGEYTVTAIVDYGGEELLGAETHITIP